MKPELKDLKSEKGKNICLNLKTNKTFFAKLKQVSVDCGCILIENLIDSSQEVIIYDTVAKLDILSKHENTDS